VNRLETAPLSKSGRCSVFPRESSRGQAGTPEIPHCRQLLLEHVRPGPDLHYSITRRLLANATSHLNVELVREDKDRFYEQYAGPAPSLVFLDADHGYEATRADIAWALRAGARCICGHDYDADKFPGVVQAVEELGGCAERVETLWLLRGRAEA